MSEQDQQHPNRQDENVIDMREQVEARKAEERERMEASFGSMPEPGRADDVDLKTATWCLNANEYGDGTLYAHLNRGRFLFNQSSGEWLSWAGHHWAVDTGDRHLQAVEIVVNYYLEAAILASMEANKAQTEAKQKMWEEQEKAFRKRGFGLRQDGRRERCCKQAHLCEEPLAIDGSELDADPWVLAVANGVVDLRTGELRNGKPEDLLLKASPVEWSGIDAPAEVWEQALNDIFNGDHDLILYVQRLLGYGITGLNREHVFPVFHGRGRNGKGLILETLQHVLGSDLAMPIETEMLLDQKFGRNAGGPSPHIMALQGCRVAIASEVDENRRISLSAVKKLTGGDTMTGRYGYDKRMSTFRTSHLLLWQVNDLPEAPGDDYATWERIQRIPFEVSFVDREPQTDFERRMDKDLPNKIMDESAGVLAWLVRGIVDTQNGYLARGGLEPPAKVLAKTKEWQGDDDYVGLFIAEMCEMGKDLSIGATDLYEAFVWWSYHKQKLKRPRTQQWFGRKLAKRPDLEKETSGTTTYYGISISTDARIEMEDSQRQYQPAA